MTFTDLIQERFPGAMATADVSDRVRRALGHAGFTQADSLLALVTCPDELCDGTRQALRQGWAPPLDGAALGGVPLLGMAGFKAAASHAPVRGGRRRLVAIVLTHVGVGPEGQIGWCLRRGIDSPSIACGALAMLGRQLASGPALSPGDPDDAALAALWAALRPEMDATEPPDLWGLTQAARRQGMSLASRHLAAIAPSYDLDYAVVSGVTIHASDYERLWVGDARTVVGGDQQAMAFD